MRIISGTAKGKKLFLPLDKNTRPLKDIVRGSIFNILSHSDLLNSGLKDTIVLDLFSGIGSFGLEAISRGAAKVFFFENYELAINILKKNLQKLSFINKSEIIKEDIYKEFIFKNLNCKFDLIFIDPPFKDERLNHLLNNMIKSKILNSTTLIIIHRKKNENINFYEKFKIIREEKYGLSKIFFGKINF